MAKLGECLCRMHKGIGSVSGREEKGRKTTANLDATALIFSSRLWFCDKSVNKLAF